MIKGRVNQNREPIIFIEIAGKKLTAIIDTGFNGDAELPNNLLSHLTASFAGEVTSILAGGYTAKESMYHVDFPFDGTVHKIEAAFALTETILIGTRLLKDYKLEIDFVKKTVLLERQID